MCLDFGICESVKSRLRSCDNGYGTTKLEPSAWVIGVAKRVCAEEPSAAGVCVGNLHQLLKFVMTIAPVVRIKDNIINLRWCAYAEAEVVLRGPLRYNSGDSDAITYILALDCNPLC